MNFKKITSITLSFLIFSSTTTFAISNTNSEKLKSKRIYGKDRYETSVNISKCGWDRSSVALICRGDSFADALSSVPLAKKYDAPILLTNKDELNKNVKDELKRLNVKKAMLIGGKGAISKKVEDEIKESLSIKNTIRFSGKDRYETSKIIAQNLNSKEVFLVSSEKPFDALSISSIAANKGIPILLVKDKQSVKNYLNKNEVKKTYIIGGKSCISEDIEKIVPNPKRIYGNDRYDTNGKILENFSDSMNFKNVYVTLSQSERGNEFSDALAVAPLAAKFNNPIVFVNKDKELCDITKKFLKSKLNYKDTLVALGGEKVLPKSFVDEICDMELNNAYEDANKDEDAKKDDTQKESSKRHHSSSDSSDSDKVNDEYNVTFKTSFPGAFTYDVKVSNGDKVLKGYKIIYNNNVISEDKDNDGITKVLNIFLSKDSDKSKFKILDNNNKEIEIEFE